MINPKRKLNNILNIISIGILLAGFILGISVKKDGSKAVPKEQLNSQLEENQPPSNTKTESKQAICKEFLEEDESSLLLKEYNKGEVAMVECLSVRCGGVF